MKRVCRRKIQIDALTLCYEVESTYYYDQLRQLDFGASIDLNEFQLTRTTGRYYDNVYNIQAWNGVKTITFGQIKFSLANGDEESNTHKNGLRKVWLSLNNETLYTQDFHFLTYIEQRLGLVFHNVTSLDLCLDTPFAVSPLIKAYIKDKSKGITILTYDKAAEISNASDKQYILEHYGNPRRLYRTEVHLNAENIKNYVARKGITYTPLVLIDEATLEDMFFHFLNSVIRFQCKAEDVGWQHILGRS